MPWKEIARVPSNVAARVPSNVAEKVPGIVFYWSWKVLQTVASNVSLVHSHLPRV